MNRMAFYQKVWNDENDVFELDFLWSNMDKFEMVYTPSHYRVVGVDWMRADMISYRMYGTVDYWWVICLVNSIDSPLEDIQLGTVLTIPNKLDIYNFYKRYRVRR